MRIEIKTIPATKEIVERAVEEKKAEDTPKKVSKRKSAKKEE